MADTNFTPSWAIPVGMNHVPAYQVSGIPWTTGSVGATGAVTKIEFPSVTRWIVINNRSLTDNVRVAFSQRGYSIGNYFEVGKQFANAGAAGSQRLELKVSEIFISGSDKVDIIAGLTSIQPGKIATSDGPSFSGSAGVG
tara:strand:- start:2485 stop:2904 length:420 start_codon:yes stop_codon:yes gene_type:complete